MRILMTGATGFVGRRLTEVLGRRDDSLTFLTRNPAEAQGALYGRGRIVGWSPPKPGPWGEELEQIDAIVNLAGAPVVGRWTESHKKAIYDSRVLGTRALVDAVIAAKHRPRVLVQASAVGYYGETSTDTDESSSAGRDFLAKVCVDWEAEAMRAADAGTRVVVIRIGIVLGPGGGAVAKMVTPFKMFVGGPLGSGKQWMSWVAIDDLVGMIELALDNPEATGPINAVAPTPVTNAHFAHELGDLLGRPAVIPTPGAALHAVLGEGADVLLKGQKVVPRRAMELEYPFFHATLRSALKASLGKEA